MALLVSLQFWHFSVIMKSNNLYMKSTQMACACSHVPSILFSLSLSSVPPPPPTFLGDSRTLEVLMFLNLRRKSETLNRFEADQRRSALEVNLVIVHLRFRKPWT